MSTRASRPDDATSASPPGRRMPLCATSASGSCSVRRTHFITAGSLVGICVSTAVPSFPCAKSIGTSARP